VKQEPPLFEILEGQCAGPSICPLSCIKAGEVVCVKRLPSSPELSFRLRELGVFEEQRIKLISQDSSLICQVCNARLGLSRKLADHILVEAVEVEAKEV
jgi:Fe2+ transport system protein FeoA